MIYFIRHSFKSDENKIIHKKQLKNKVNIILKNIFSEYGINYCEEELVFNSHGKPYLKNHSDMFFNISHCHELAVCTVGNTELGIDVENIRKYSPRVVNKVFSESEKNFLEKTENKNEAFFRIWTLKESFVKALGIGISYPMKTCEFLFNGNEIISNGCNGYSFSQIILNDNFICSLCKKSATEQKNQFYKISNDEALFCLK